MNETTAILLGLTTCCVIPLLMLFAGIYIGKHGIPLQVRWRPKDDDE